MSVGSQTTLAGAATTSESMATCFAVGAFWAVFGAAVSRGLTLAALVLAGRMLGTTGFGEVNMIQSTQGLFGVLAGAGLGLAATKFVAEFRSVDPARAGRCITLATLVAIISGIVGGGVLLVFADKLSESVLEAPHLKLELQIATGLILFGAINGVQIGALAGLGDFRMVAIINIVRGACLFVSLLIGISVAGVLGGVIGLVATEAFAVVVSQMALQRLFPQRWSDLFQGGMAWSEFDAMMRFSGLAVLASLATTSAMWFSNVVLATQNDGYASLGIFNAADRWRQVLLFLPASLAPIAMSMLSNLHGTNDPTGYRKLIGFNLWISLVVVGLPATVLMLLAPLAMSVFGAEYEIGAMTLVILAGSTLGVVMNTLLGQVLISKGGMGWRFAMDLLLAGVLAAASWLLVPVLQEQGLALAHLIAYSCTAVALILPVIWQLRNS